MLLWHHPTLSLHLILCKNSRIFSPEENRTKVSKKGISIILTNLLRLSFFQTEIELNFLVHLSFYFDEITFHILRQNFFCAVGEKNNFILASESRIKFSANSRSAKKSKGRMYRLCTSKVTFCWCLGSSIGCLILIMIITKIIPKLRSIIFIGLTFCWTTVVDLSVVLYLIHQTLLWIKP